MNFEWYEWTIMGLVAFFALLTVLKSCFVVEQSEVVLIERFGKFKKLAEAGLHFKVPFVDVRTPAISLRLQQQNIEVQSKTKDNVTVVVSVALQFKVQDAKTSWYALDDESQQFKSFVQDAVRGVVPSQTLDVTFENGSDLIAKRIEEYLQERMKQYGYHLDTALVTAITPDKGVLQAMNEINAAERMKAAAKEQADAAYNTSVRQAEAEARSKELQGEGMAKQRLAITKGLKESIEDLKAVGGEIDSKEILATILLTQFLDTQHAIGTSANTKVIFLPNSPNAVKDLSAQILQGTLAGGLANGV